MSSKTNYNTTEKENNIIMKKSKAFLEEINFSLIREKSMKLILINAIAYVLTMCNINGKNPVSPAFFASMCFNGCGGVITMIIQLFGLIAYSANSIVAVKYVSIMISIYSISKLIQYSKVQVKIYTSAAICMVICMIMEIGSYMMNLNSIDDMISSNMKNTIIVFATCVLTAGLVIIFSKGIQIINKKKAILNNEEIFSVAIVFGVVLHQIGTNHLLPLEILNSVIYLAILYGGYRYGTGMGAGIGAACGICTCLWKGNAQILGIFCILGIVAGTFREMGRLTCTFALLCTAITAGQISFSYFIGSSAVKGMIGGGIIFLFLPKRIAFRCEENMSDNMQKKIESICEEKLMRVANSFEKLSHSILDISKINIKSDTIFDEEERVNKILKNKLEENRMVMSKQLQQISQIIEEYSKEIYDLVNISAQEEEYIRNKMKLKKITVGKIAGIENKRHKREYLVTAKCEKGMTIGTREIAQIISEAMGKTYMPARNCRKVLSSEFTTTNYVEEANFYVLHAAAKKARGNNGISGDNYSFLELNNGQMVMSLSDGMGYGTSACIESETVIELLEQLLDSGFSEDTALRMINSVMLMNSEQEHPATLDFGVINLHSGVCDLVKIGAAATFVKRGKWVETIKSTSMPLGMFGEVDYDSTSKKLYDGDMIIMVSDGVLDAIECENKDECLGNIIMKIDSKNPKEIANIILNEAITDHSKLTDDMTVLVTGIWNNKKKIA